MIKTLIEFQKPRTQEMSVENVYMSLDKVELRKALNDFIVEVLSPLSKKYDMDLAEHLQAILKHVENPTSTLEKECTEKNLNPSTVMREVAELLLGNTTYEEIQKVYEFHKAEEDQLYDLKRCVKLSSIHSHHLSYNGNLWDHYCNVCKEDTFEAYRCQRCDYDCCPNCCQKLIKSE